MMPRAERKSDLIAERDERLTSAIIPQQRTPLPSEQGDASSRSSDILITYPDMTTIETTHLPPQCAGCKALRCGATQIPSVSSHIRYVASSVERVKSVTMFCDTSPLFHFISNESSSSFTYPFNF
jgi:hypothetical protein